MNENALASLESGSEEEALSLLKDFNAKHVQVYQFSEFTTPIKRRFLEALIRRLSEKSSSRLCVVCLESIRIISREKTGLDTVSTEKALKILIGHAGLDTSYLCDDNGSVTIQDVFVIVEAQKCLCNIIFNSIDAQRICSFNGCIEGIVQRLKTYKDPSLVHEIKFFDMRMLFLLTALSNDVRPRLRQELHGFTYLIEVLDLSLRSADEAQRPLSDQEVDLCCEVLKILFNITVGMEGNSLDEEEEAHFMRLVSVLHDLLVSDTANKEKKDELQNHTVNLLTNMPRESYEELLTPATDDATSSEACAAAAMTATSDVVYDGKNMEAIVEMLAFLKKRLDVPQQGMKEALTPILHCLSQICRANRSIRKFCRLRVLPYLKDEVMLLPEEGATLRNKLCKLFTSPITEVKDLAADFTFVLCKENVGRFVKYTGYGNAAGLLAQRGLMCGGQGAIYSSESEDSETEEYSQLKDNVNPVTGRWEESKTSAMEGMSEEQKEYEAMQLVNKLDKLQRAGVIQPTKISDDGKPVPVEHVAELLEGVRTIGVVQPDNSGSDSD
jgi:hypothetical protein